MERRSTLIRDTERHFDALSGHYDEYARRRLSYVSRVDELIASHVEARSPCSYVDVGCGTGRLLARLRERVPESRGLGVDVSTKMVARCRERGLDAVKADFIDFRPDPPADVLVLEFNVFGYLVVQNGLAATLDHMREVIGDRGTLLFDILNPYCVTHGSLLRTVPTALARRVSLVRGHGTLRFDYTLEGNRIAMGVVDRRLVTEHLRAAGFQVDVHWIEYADHWLSGLAPRALTSQVFFAASSEQ